MDVLAIIKQDHEAIRTKLNDLATATGVKKRREAFQHFSNQANLALALGRDYLYPELDGLFVGSETLVSNAVGQGREFEKKIRSLQRIVAKPATEQKTFPKKFEELGFAAQSYIGLVEEAIMPKIRTFIRTEDREDLADVFEDAKEAMQLGVGVSTRKPLRKRA